MKKILIIVSILLATASFAKDDFVKIKGFTDLQFSQLAAAIEREVDSLENVKILSMRRTAFDVFSAVYETAGFFGGATHTDYDYFKLIFQAELYGNIEKIKCSVMIYKNGFKSIDLKKCKGKRVELADDHMSIDLAEVGVTRTYSNRIIVD